MRPNQFLVPNFLYIGPDKAGSTWIYKALKNHSEVFMSPAKELFFFDQHYNWGINWYMKHFRNADPEHKVIGEVSHDYLFSVDACMRIASDLPDAKMMVCFREPVARAFSSYLYMIRQGRVNGSFEEVLKEKNELVEHGLYAKHIEPYISKFGTDRIYFGIFDDLKSDPSQFAKKLFRFLGIYPIDLPPDLLDKSLPASRPRSEILAKYAKQAALFIRKLGLPIIVGRIKSAALVEKFLYKPYQSSEKPKISHETRRMLKKTFYKDIIRLEGLTGLNLIDLWGYKEL